MVRELWGHHICVSLPPPTPPHTHTLTGCRALVLLGMQCARVRSAGGAAQVRLGSHGNSNEHDLALFIKYALPRMYQPCVAVPAQS